MGRRRMHVYEWATIFSDPAQCGGCEQRSRTRENTVRAAAVTGAEIPRKYLRLAKDRDEKVGVVGERSQIPGGEQQIGR